MNLDSGLLGPFILLEFFLLHKNNGICLFAHLHGRDFKTLVKRIVREPTSLVVCHKVAELVRRKVLRTEVSLCGKFYPGSRFIFYKMVHRLRVVKEPTKGKRWMPIINNQHQVCMGRETSKRRVGAPLTSSPNIIEPKIAEETWKRKNIWWLEKAVFTVCWYSVSFTILASTRRVLKYFSSLMQKLGQPRDKNQV